MAKIYVGMSGWTYPNWRGGFYPKGLCLREKMGPILWQFPPNVMLKDDRFEKFLKLLPYDSKAAARLARNHGDKVKGRSFTTISGDYPIRHAFEFRNDSFMNEGFIEMLREYGVAMVFAHSGEKSPYTEDLTSDFVYLRMHGQESKYKKGYTNETQNWLASRVQTWARGDQPKDVQSVTDAKPKKLPRDIFVYFDTEAKDYAPFDALNLMDKLKIKIPKAG